MFVRSKSSVRNGASYEYLQIVRSYREGGRVRQQVIASLGRRDRLIASGELDGLLRSLAKFSDNLRVVEAVRTSGLAARAARQWGPALVFGRLWDRQGLPDLLGQLAQDRKFEFDLERAAFAMALQRLCAPAPISPARSGSGRWPRLGSRAWPCNTFTGPRRFWPGCGRTWKPSSFAGI